MGVVGGGGERGAMRARVERPGAVRGAVGSEVRVGVRADVKRTSSARGAPLSPPPAPNTDPRQRSPPPAVVDYNPREARPSALGPVLGQGAEEDRKSVV